jgi:hypothetical protein
MISVCCLPLPTRSRKPEQQHAGSNITQFFLENICVPQQCLKIFAAAWDWGLLLCLSMISGPWIILSRLMMLLSPPVLLLLLLLLTNMHAEPLFQSVQRRQLPAHDTQMICACNAY